MDAAGDCFMDAYTDYDRGEAAGYAGSFTLLIKNRHNEEFCKGFAAGREREQRDYKSRYWDAWIWTDGMARGDSARRLRDEE